MFCFFLTFLLVYSLYYSCSNFCNCYHYTALSLIMLLLFPGSFVDRGKSVLLTFIRAEKVLRNLMPKLILISNLPVSIVPVVTYSSFSVWK